MSGVEPMRLWYRSPAQDWNEALPVGNGRLGAMVFGAAGREQLQLNEDSVWHGEPVDRNNPDALGNLREIRELILKGRIAEAERLAALALSGVPDSQRTYQTMGELFVSLRHPAGEAQGYERGLDLRTAVSTVRYTLGGVAYARECFVSAPDQVLVLRLTVDAPAGISFDACLRRGRSLDKAGRLDSSTIFLDASCGGGQAVRFRTLARAVAEGGTVSVVGETLVVDKADAVTLFVACETSFRHGDFQQACLRRLSDASGKPYTGLKRSHTEDYARLFNRVELTLGRAENRGGPEALPTDARLARLADGEDDPGLVSLYFQYGRYLLICCSRPGTLPANLQGIWCRDMTPPWDSKYTININTQMNYWPAETCDLPECHLPLFDLIERMREPGRRTARVMYGCRGFTAHHNTDIWADTAPQDVWIPATYWPMGAAWLCLHLWEHYEFNPDPEFLKRAYPTMREAAEFFTDYLIEDAKGRLVTCPSVSPENTYILENGERGCLCAGPSMDSQILRLLFARCLQAAGALGIADAFTATVEKMLDRLPAPQAGRHGQLMEWAEDYDEAEPGHRHISHLFALYPGNLISAAATPELARAARVTLERRLAHGGGHTGWSRAWIINLWARLGDGEKAWENVLELLRKSTLPNLLDNHPPFQIDGNFGGTAGIAEMLLQSHGGEVILLPALPQAWPDGKVSGLRARGGIGADIAWEGGKLVSAVLRASHAGAATVRYGNTKAVVEIAKGCGVTLDGSLKETGRVTPETR